MGNPLDLCPCASLVLEAQAAGMIPLPVVTGTVSASAGVTLGARDLTQQPAVAQLPKSHAHSLSRSFRDKYTVDLKETEKETKEQKKKKRLTTNASRGFHV